MDCYDELGNRYQLPIYCLSVPINLVEETNESESPAAESEPWSGGGEEITVKFRLSTSGKDIKVAIRTGETVLTSKKRLQIAEGIDPSRQRWYFGGRLLHDKMKVEEAKLQTGFVVQVVVTPLNLSST
ncbi:ubiquitin domain-containing protein 1 [Caerostris extrusa]|nr:ubiquitin domain-containing protein 1 [Caerostris extrusa]